jgi:N-acetyl sugar amidotransferase
MKYCSRCVYPENHPFGIIFDAEGICSGCRIHEEKDNLDWNNRETKLEELLQQYKNKSNSNYDCIVPVTGGKDSYFIVDTVLNKYRMNPLLVYFNTHYNSILGLRNLQNLKTVFGCDIIQLNINPEVAKEIVRYTLPKFRSIYWHNHAGYTVFPVQISVRLKIPLIIWGLHQGIDQVGMFSHTDEVEMTRKYRKDHDLLGIEPEDLIEEQDCPDNIKAELKKFFYPSDQVLKEVGTRGIYLNNYIRWDSKNQHENMIRRYDYQSCEQSRTFNTYDDINCLLYNDVHDLIKYNKLGYSKVYDHVTQEIRLKRMSRDNGLKIIKKYELNESKYLDIFANWVGMKKYDITDYIYQNKINKKIFDYKISREILENAKLEIIQSPKFIKNTKCKLENSLNSFTKGVYL